MKEELVVITGPGLRRVLDEYAYHHRFETLFPAIGLRSLRERRALATVER
jgi:hypothetical protein